MRAALERVGTERSVSGTSEGVYQSSPSSAPSVSGLEVHVLVRELARLVGSYVSNIHTLGESQLLTLKRSAGAGEEQSEAAEIVFSPRAGAWITQKPAYGATSDFTSALRERLLRRKLESVTQYDLDRVILLRFAGREDKVDLILELMPPGNVILADSGGTIIVALREVRRGPRHVLRGRPYAPPPQSRGSPSAIDDASLREALARESTVGKALGRGFSLPRRYVTEILSRASLRQSDSSSGIEGTKLREVVEVVRGMVQELDAPSPSISELEGTLELMSVVPVQKSRVIEKGETMSGLMDKTFMPLLVQLEERGGAQQELGESARIKEMQVSINRLDEQIAALRDTSTNLRRVANAVRGASSQDEIRELLRSAPIAKEEGERLAKNPSNASVSSRLYDIAKMDESEVARMDRARQDMATRMEKAEAKAPREVSKVRVVDRGRREWYEKFRWFYTTEGRLAVGGRDAQSNSILIKKHAVEGDTVFHADLFGSPFFVLKGGKAQTPEEIRQVAQATAAFSSAWKTGLSAADAYWVAPDQVSNTAQSGEYLARGSFVIRGKKNFVTKNPIEIAVGIDVGGRIVAGPEEAIMKQSKSYITLIPHREKSSDTAKKGLAELRKMYGDRLGSDSLDEMARMLPAGGGKIIRRREGKDESEAV